MHFDGNGVQADPRSALASRAAVAAAVSVFVALTFGSSGQALAQCAGSYPSSSGSGVRPPASPNAGVHTTTSAPPVHSGSSSCPTGGTTTNTHAVHLNTANLNSGTGRPPLAGAGHLHSTQHENSDLVKPNSKGVKL